MRTVPMNLSANGKNGKPLPAGVDAAPGGIPRMVFGFTIRNGRVVEIELAADPERLSRLKIEILP